MSERTDEERQEREMADSRWFHDNRPHLYRRRLEKFNSDRTIKIGPSIFSERWLIAYKIARQGMACYYSSGQWANHALSFIYPYAEYHGDHGSYAMDLKILYEAHQVLVRALQKTPKPVRRRAARKELVAA